MDHASLAHGTVVSVYLVALIVCLVAFLVWQRLPRGTIFEIVYLPVVIFAISADLSYQVADRMVLNGDDSLLIYIPPVFPVAIFVAWSSRRAKKR
jgi:hypothetical protein